MAMNFAMDPRMMGLLGLGSGLLSASGSSPREITLGEAMGQGLQAGMLGMQQGLGMQMQQQHLKAIENEARMKEQKLARQMEIDDYLRRSVGGGETNDPIALGKAMISSGYQELIPIGANLLKTKQAKSFIKGLDDKGQPTYYTGYSTGEVSPTGVTPAEKLMQINQGSQIGLANPYTGEIQRAVGVGMAPGEAARLAQSERHFGQSQDLARQNAFLQQEKLRLELDPEYQARKAELIAQGRERGQIQAKAKADLPNVITQGEQTIQLVDDLLQHPGFSVSVGKSAPLGSLQSYIPGTQAASFDIALKQLKGKQFLEAFESLKGGGQITQIEGEKATQAMSRMEKANTEAEFSKASREFQDIIRRGVNRAKMRAGGQAESVQEPTTFNDGWGELR